MQTNPPVVLMHDDSGVDWSELSSLYLVAPLGHKPADLLKVAFSNSMFKCFAFAGSFLVGAGRAVADGVDCSYICDVAVLPEFQGAGLGRRIVEDLVESSRGHAKIILYSVPGVEGFYRSMGFRRMNTAMAIFGDDKAALEKGYLSDA
jgi:ribosomal protein S18 acetylase RimI-like enzyme